MAANYTARLPSVLVVLDVAFVAFIAYITPNMHAYRFGSFLLATHSGNCPRIPHGAMFFPQLYPHHRSTHLQDGSMISKSQPHTFRPLRTICTLFGITYFYGAYCFARYADISIIESLTLDLLTCRVPFDAPIIQQHFSQT